MKILYNIKNTWVPLYNNFSKSYKHAFISECFKDFQCIILISIKETGGRNKGSVKAKQWASYQHLV
jgi:hypothetical protein